MVEGIRVETDDGVSTIELPKDREHLGFVNLPKDTQFVVYDDGEYAPIEIRHGKSSLVLMLERDQHESLIQALGFGPSRNRGTYGHLQRLINESGCLKVQIRVKQLIKTRQRSRSGSLHRSYNFKKWFAGKRTLPGRWTSYYDDYLPGHEFGHHVNSKTCRNRSTSPCYSDATDFDPDGRPH